MVVLQEHIESHEVHLLEVWVGDSIVDVVLRDEGHQLSEESLLLLLLLRTSCHFLARLLPEREVTRRIDLSSFEGAVAHVVLLRGIVLPWSCYLVANGHARRHYQLALPLHHAEQLEWNLNEVVGQNVDEVGRLRVDVVYQLQEPNRELHQLVPRVSVLEAEAPELQLLPQDFGHLVEDLARFLDAPLLGEVQVLSVVHVHLVQRHRVLLHLGQDAVYRY